MQDIDDGAHAVRSDKFVADFFRIFYEPSIYFHEFISNDQIPSLSFIFLFLFLLISFVANYWLFSNHHLVEAMLTADKQYYTTDSQRESAERVRESTERALEMPGIGLIIASKVGWSTARSIFCFLLLVWFAISILSDRWNLSRQFVHVVSVSSGILILGVIVNTLSRVVFQRFTAMFSPVFFVRPFANTIFFHYLSIHIELFTVWYLITISIGITILYEQKFVEVLLLVLGVYCIVIFLAFIIGYQFVLI